MLLQRQSDRGEKSEGFSSSALRPAMDRIAPSALLRHGCLCLSLASKNLKRRYFRLLSHVVQRLPVVQTNTIVGIMSCLHGSRDRTGAWLRLPRQTSILIRSITSESSISESSLPLRIFHRLSFERARACRGCGDCQAPFAVLPCVVPQFFQRLPALYPSPSLEHSIHWVGAGREWKGMSAAEWQGLSSSGASERGH